jgi:hypothetical protein
MGKRYSPTQNYGTPMPTGEAITMDVDSIDDLIRSQGVMFEHWTAMRCPVGMIDRHDSLRRPHEHHEGCSNGFVYTKEGEVQALLTGNGLGVEQKDLGVLDSSTASMTFPRFYSSEDCQEEKRIYLAPYDRLYYKDEGILVTNWETVEAHLTGYDRLDFPPVEITRLMDNQGISYTSDDYRIVNGQIQWKGNRQPGRDPETGKGRIYSVRYRYRPHWYIKSLGHEIRTVNVDDPISGERRAEKMPQNCIVQREFIFLNQEKDESASDARQTRSPAEGGFGPK